MSESKIKLLLIDGNNMCHRVFWSNKTLSHGNQMTGVLFGFMRQLVSLHKDYPDHFRIIVWDGGYARRLAESEAAVSAGLIPSAYKAPRKLAAEENQEERKVMFDQMDQLKELFLPKIKCVQIRKDGIEADDIIHSYCQYAAKWDGEAVVVSSDRDFYQVLGINGNIRIHDAMKKEVWTKERFTTEFGLDPALWVDVGALMGDASDNIHGVDGWGPKTACDYVRQYGTITSILDAVRMKAKQSKKELALLASGTKLQLAVSLKKMDLIPDIPMPRMMTPADPEEIKKLFIEFGMISLLKEVGRLI